MGCHPAARGTQLTDLPDDLLCHVLSLIDPAGTHAATAKEWHQLVLACRAFARCLPACINAKHTINTLEDLQGLLVAGLAGRLTVPVSYLRLERSEPHLLTCAPQLGWRSADLMAVALRQCLSTSVSMFLMSIRPCATADQPCDEVMCLFCGTSSRCSRSGQQHTGVLGLLKHPEALQILEMPYIFSAKAQVRPATEWLPRFRSGAATADCHRPSVQCGRMLPARALPHDPICQHRFRPCFWP